MDFNIDPNELAELMDKLSAGSERTIQDMRRLSTRPLNMANLQETLPWARVVRRSLSGDVDALLKPSLTVAEVQRLSLLDDADLEMAAQDMARQLLDNADRRLFGVAPDPMGIDVHAYTDEDEPSLTLDALEEAMAELNAMGPFPIELWFVDCREQYHAFVNSLPTTPVTHATLGAGQMHFAMPMGAMPVIEWYMRYFDEETETIARKDEDLMDRQRIIEEHGYERVWPWFVAIPGIWVKMNDGNVKRIGPDNHLWARFQYWAGQQQDAE